MTEHDSIATLSDEQIKGNFTPIMTADAPISEKKLNAFLSGIPVVKIAERIAAATGGHVPDIAAKLDIYINEARISFRLVEPRLNRRQRLLEAGAGLCLLSLFLKREGYNITALEPALGGFGLFDVARQAILRHYRDIPLVVLDCPAQQLNRRMHGEFDLIFSNNVIEHIPDWQAALAAMNSVLAQGGRMIHACPNYTVPYEPHYGVPVFRRFPKLSRRLFLPSGSNPEIWDSLNFIRSCDIRRFCAERQLRCRFEKALLYKALRRISEDPLFRSRHAGPVATCAALLQRSGLLHLFRYMPVALSTPMVFEIARQPAGKTG